MTHDAVLAAARDPARFPHAAGPVRLVETHISWVYLTGDRAYKVRKQVVFPFLDYGTAARRRTMCEEEVRLGRRLAPHIYVGVRSLVEQAGRLALAPADDPDAVEHVVEMRLFDEQETLAACLERDEVSENDVRGVGRAIAAFHDGAEVPRDAAGTAAAVAEMVDQNFDTLLDHAAAVDPRGLAAAHRFAVAFVHGRSALIDGRAQIGCVREGHGDLRAEHVLPRDPVEVFDPLEFDPALRTIDVASDLAFLVMDLVAAQRDDLAAVLTDEYRQHSSLPWCDELLWFYAAYRAWVRAKVECLRAGELPAGEPSIAHLRSAKRLGELGGRLAWRARRPLTVVVCGSSATGKTYLAQALAELSGLPHINSDIVRKQLAGLRSEERAPESEYSEQASVRTYRELGRRAAASDPGAIVDATFRRRSHRAAFADGYGAAAEAPVFVECVAPARTVAERALLRAQESGRVSDATPELARRMRDEFESLDEIDAAQHAILRTDRDVVEIVDDLAAALDARLARGESRA